MAANARTTSTSMLEAYSRKESRAKKLLRHLFPCINWIPHYSLQKLECDVVAGITVGLMVIPQGLAYAKIAGLSAQYGLYSSLMGVFMYCIFGGAKDVSVGPTAIMSLLVSTDAVVKGKTSPTEAVTLSLMVGVILTTMGLFQLGFLLEFISIPTIAGFTAAAAITIGFGEVKDLLGLHDIRRDFIPCVEDTFSKLGQSRVCDLALGLTCMLLLLLLKELKTKVDGRKTRFQSFVWFLTTARNAVVVILAGCVGYIFHTHTDGSYISLLGKVPSGLPPFVAPEVSISLIKKLGLDALVIALVGFLESIAIAQSFARANKYEVSASQELVAVGMGNLMGSFIKAYPVTGSFSRTAVNASSGAQTQFAGAMTGLVIIISLVSLTDSFYFIPNAALAAIIISALAHLVDYEVFKQIWKIKKIDTLPYVVSFWGVLLLGVELGIMFAVIVSVLILLYLTARPAHTTLSLDPVSNAYVPTCRVDLDACDSGDVTGITIARLGGNIVHLSMAGVKSFMLKQQFEDQSFAFILDCSNVRYIDYSGVQFLKEMVETFDSNEVQLMFVHLDPSVQESLHAGGVLGDAPLYHTLHDAVAAAQDYILEQGGKPRRGLPRGTPSSVN